MSITYHALARVFGTVDAVSAVRKLFLESEASNPGYSFSIELLDTTGTDTCGFIVRGELNRDPPSFAALDYQAEGFSRYPHLIIELLVSADDSQTHSVFHAGDVIYEAKREEATGDVFALGTPGLTYHYGRESGIRDAFLLAIQAANASHRLLPL
jgi:hypothetical protein